MKEEFAQNGKTKRKARPKGISSDSWRCQKILRSEEIK